MKKLKLSKAFPFTNVKSKTNLCLFIKALRYQVFLIAAFDPFDPLTQKIGKKFDMKKLMQLAFDYFFHTIQIKNKQISQKERSYIVHFKCKGSPHVSTFLLL